jgi:hypothetical protein
MKPTAGKTAVLGFAIVAYLLAYLVAICANFDIRYWAYGLLFFSVQPWIHAAAILFPDSARVQILAPVGGVLLNMGLLLVAGYWIATRARGRN